MKWLPVQRRLFWRNCRFGEAGERCHPTALAHTWQSRAGRSQEARENEGKLGRPGEVRSVFRP
jgi:hypothetical protein